MKKGLLLLFLVLFSTSVLAAPSYTTEDYTAFWRLNDTFYADYTSSNNTYVERLEGASSGGAECGTYQAQSFTVSNTGYISEVSISGNAYTFTRSDSVLVSPGTYYVCTKESSNQLYITSSLANCNSENSIGPKKTVSSELFGLEGNGEGTGYYYDGSWDSLNDNVCLSSSPVQDWRVGVELNNVTIVTKNIKDETGTNDGTGYGKTFYDGTVNGATWSTSSPVDGNLAKYGGYYDFDGNDYINTASGIFSSDIFTISLFIESKDFTTPEAYYQHRDGVTDTRLYLAHDSDNNLDYTVGSTKNFITSLNPNTRYYVTIIVDTLQNITDVYVNGNIVKDDAPFSHDGSGFDSYLALGSNGANSGSFLNGSIDEVRIWSRALSQSEIEAEMNSSSPVNNEGLVAYYGFNNYINDTFTPDQNFLTQGYEQNVYSSDEPAFSYKPATYFDGEDDYIRFNDLGIVNEPITVSMWFNPLNQKAVSGEGWMLNQGTEIILRYDEDGSGFAQFIINDLGTNDRVQTSTPMPRDNWYNIIGTYNGSELCIYLNGFEEDCLPTSGSYSNSGDWLLGSTTTIFNGSISDVLIYNRSLSLIEIEQLWNQSRNSFLHVNATDYFNGSAISGFNVSKDGQTWYQSGNYFSTAIQNGSQTVLFTDADYIDENETILINEYNEYYTWPGLPANTLNLTFKDEATDTLINQNITVKVQTDTAEDIYILENGTGIIRNLSQSVNYRLVFNTNGYTERTDQFLSNGEFFTSSTYYLTNSSDGNVSNVEITILDEDGRPLENVNIVIKAAVSGSYTQVEEGLTDINGELVASLDTSKRHLFELSKENYTSKSFFINEPLTTTYTFTLDNLIQTDFENELDGVEYSYDPGKGVLIYNRTYVFNWSVNSPDAALSDLYAQRFIIYEYNTSGDKVATYYNTSTNNEGELLTLDVDLSNKINYTIEFIFCFQKDGYSEYCLGKKLPVLEQRIDTNNLYGIRDYVAENYSTGQRVVMWVMAWIICSILILAVPFFRNALAIVPISTFALFFGWLFLPVSYIITLGMFVFMGALLLFTRFEV
jgi:hypothetical protein